MNNHESYLERALELASESAVRGTGPFGAVVVREGKIIAEGWNQVTEKNDPTAHAEMSAIRESCQTLNSFILKDCDLYTSSYPCPMCFGAIYWAHIRKTYFANSIKVAQNAGFDDSLIHSKLCTANEVQSPDFEHVELPTPDRPFQIWQNNSDKVSY